MAKLLGSETLGRNIQRLRQERGLTQSETVAQMQVLGSPLSRSTFSLIEMGRGNIFASDLVALKMVLQVEFEEFFRDIPPSRQARTEE